MKLLVTGATGKVGQRFLDQFCHEPSLASWQVRALCHNPVIDTSDRVKLIKGSLAEPETIKAALDGITHVLHMAAVKESPDMAIDVSLKGLFLLLEEARQSPTFSQFVLISGDCAVGHFFHDYESPITEASPRKAHQGCYALTKVLEEVMLEQYQIQYGMNGCILRAPWIMEKDDFKCALSFGSDQFGGPLWDTLLKPEQVKNYLEDNLIPLLLDAKGAPLKRNFIHVDDLVSAIICALDNPRARQSLYNVSMDSPVDYGLVAAHIESKHGNKPAQIRTPFHSNWLDTTKAKLHFGWQPETDYRALIDRAWAYERAPNNPRQVWYPG